MSYEVQTPDKVVQDSIQNLDLFINGRFTVDNYIDLLQMDAFTQALTIPLKMQSFQDYKAQKRVKLIEGKPNIRIQEGFLIEMLDKRSLAGIEKYGTTLQDANLTKEQLLQHALEECLDLINYLEALKAKINQSDNGREF